MEGRQLSPAAAATVAARANAADATLGGEGHGEDSVFSAQRRGDKHFRREKCRPLLSTALRRGDQTTPTKTSAPERGGKSATVNNSPWREESCPFPCCDEKMLPRKKSAKDGEENLLARQG